MGILKTKTPQAPAVPPPPPPPSSAPSPMALKPSANKPLGGTFMTAGMSGPQAQKPFLG